MKATDDVGIDQTQGSREMQELLAMEGVPPTIRSGDLLTGVVMGVEPGNFLVSIGHKSEGVVPPQEMRSLSPEAISKIRVGDEILISVLRPDTDEQPALLSLDRAIGEQGWQILEGHLQNNQHFEGLVTGWNRGGLLATFEAIEGFVPLSHLASLPRTLGTDNRDEGLEALVGKTLSLKVLEVDRRRRRVVFSERLAVQDRKEGERQRLLQELHEGDIQTGYVTRVAGFGAFVDLGGVDGLIHISELSWSPIETVEDVLKVGDEVQVYVLRVDTDTGRIGLSLRRLEPGPWEDIEEHYREGQLTTGRVTKLAPFGAFVRIDDSLEGMIHISELTERAVQHPKEVVREGDVLTVKILRIDTERQRIALSLKQAEELL